jgi:hypothetical protein
MGSRRSTTLRQLYRAMHLGSLGEQFVLKSEKAFNSIRFAESITADGAVYFAKRTNRDNVEKSKLLLFPLQ